MFSKTMQFMPRAMPKTMSTTPALRLQLQASRVPSSGFATFRRLGKAPSFGQAWTNRAPGMSSTRKAMLTLAGTGGLIAIGTIAVAGNYSLTADTTASGAWPDYVQQRIKLTYGYVAVGLAATGISAAGFWRAGLAQRMMAMNPWVALGFSLGATLGSMVLVFSTPYEEGSPRKLGALVLFNAAMGVSLCTLGGVTGGLLVQAAAGTAVMVGSLSLVAANSPSEQFLWMGGPLTVGLGVVVISSFGAMFFPPSSLLNHIYLYGGLGLFGGFVLHDTSKVITKAEHMADFDPINESLDIYLDIINIFIRLVTILGSSNKK